MERESAQIWLPPSFVARDILEARQAAQDYDPNLDFGFNEKTQQWCVYLKKGTMEGSANYDIPILGFQNVPSRGEIQKRLYQSDAFRRGMEIMDDLQRDNDRLIDVDTSDVDGNVAEHLEWGFRKMGSEKAPIKVFMPGEK